MDELELSIQRSGTIAFILADAEFITLMRSEKVPDGAGGHTFTPRMPLVEQVCRLIPQSDRVNEFRSSDGRMALPEFVILLEPGGDIRRYDQFAWRGMNWEIAQVHAKPDYELKGDVIRYG